MTSSTNRIISPTRSKATWKPGVFDESLPFYFEASCSSVFVAVDGGSGPRYTGAGRRPIIELPYAIPPETSLANNEYLHQLNATPACACSHRLMLSYDLVGGLNSNAIRVFWEASEAGCEPRWFALKTFTGFQLKYVLPQKSEPIVFALGDEDAYVYCNENPCTCCTFHCKRGFELYTYTEALGLVSLSIHRERVSM